MNDPIGTCDICGMIITEIDDLGFLGTPDGSECHPFVHMLCKCQECECKQPTTMEGGNNE
jgi:hypothetical protein